MHLINNMVRLLQHLHTVCCRFFPTSQVSEIAKRFKVQAVYSPDTSPRYNIAPNQDITSSDETFAHLEGLFAVEGENINPPFRFLLGVETWGIHF